MPNTAVELAIVLSARDAASSVLEGVSKKVEGVGAAGKVALAGVAALATAGIGAVTTMVAFAEHTAEVAGEIRKLSRETGMAAESTSVMRYAAERLNVPIESLSKGFGIFSKNIETQAKKMHELGVEVEHNADGTVDLAGTIGDLAEKFKRMPDGVEKTALAMELFGKGGKDLLPIMNLGQDGLQGMTDEATKLGLVMSKEGVESARQFGLAQKDLADRFEGMKMKIGTAVMPILTKFFEFLSEVADKVLPPITEMFGHLVDILGEVFGVLSGKAPDAGAALKAAIGPDAAKIVMGALGNIRDTAKEVFQRVQDAIGFLKEHWDFFGPAFAAVAIGVIVPAMVAWSVAAITAATATVIALLPVLVPLALIGAAVGVLALAWKNNFDDIQGKTRDAINFILDIFDGLHIAALLIWRAILNGIAAIINGVIGVINGFIEAYDNVAEKLGLPILGKIELVTPNLSQINADIDQVAKDRNARITVTTSYVDPGPPGRGRSYQHGTAYVPETGLAFLHKGEAVIPASANRSGIGGGGGVTINISGDVVGLTKTELADEIGRIWTQSRRSQALA